MKCPSCSFEATRVIDSREAEDSIRRRRECIKCNYRFTTYEKNEEISVMVIKKDETREPFSDEKLFKGIARACEKRPVSAEVINKLISDVEQEIRESLKSEVKTTEIGRLVMEKLKFIDEVAYIRFASVYRQFKDVESFKKEIEKLKSKK